MKNKKISLKYKYNLYLVRISSSFCIFALLLVLYRILPRLSEVNEKNMKIEHLKIFYEVLDVGYPTIMVLQSFIIFAIMSQIIEKLRNNTNKKIIFSFLDYILLYIMCSEGMILPFILFIKLFNYEYLISNVYCLLGLLISFRYIIKSKYIFNILEIK